MEKDKGMGGNFWKKEGFRGSEEMREENGGLDQSML